MDEEVEGAGGAPGERPAALDRLIGLQQRWGTADDAGADAAQLLADMQWLLAQMGMGHPVVDDPSAPEWIYDDLYDFTRAEIDADRKLVMIGGTFGSEHAYRLCAPDGRPAGWHWVEWDERHVEHITLPATDGGDPYGYPPVLVPVEHFADVLSAEQLAVVLAWMDDLLAQVRAAGTSADVERLEAEITQARRERGESIANDISWYRRLLLGTVGIADTHRVTPDE